MSTINDVAKLAGVSRGTVSNVINGAKFVNSTTVSKVEAAIKELHYQPDDKARGLRSSRTTAVGVILPNVTDHIYAGILAGMENRLQESGFDISLCLTNDIPDREHDALLHFQQMKVSAVILISCDPQNTELFESMISSGTRLIFLLRRPAASVRSVYLGADFRELFYAAACRCLDGGMPDLRLLTGSTAYSCDSEAAEGFRQAVMDHHILFHDSDIRSADGSKEDAFHKAMWWLQSSSLPAAILTTCSAHAEGILAAVRMFAPAAASAQAVLSLDNVSWTDRILSSPIQKIPVDFCTLGEEGAEKAIMPSEEVPFKDMPVPGGHSEKGSRQECSPSPAADTVPHAPAAGIVPHAVPHTAPHMSSHPPLHLVLLEGAASYALRLMLPRFTRQTGIRVEAEALTYSEMQQYVMNPELCGSCDILQTNSAWFKTLVSGNVFLPLTDLLGSSADRFSETVRKQYGLYDGHLYGMPYMLDAQLLFYRRDLFEDIHVQRLYYEQNRKELKLPGTWQEYAQTAAFFTKKDNPLSPVEYGTTMGGRPNYSVYGFMPVFWNSGADLCDQKGVIRTDSAAFDAALKQYAGLFAFADPRAVDWGWSEQTTAFAAGNAAMMILYQAHYMDYLHQEPDPFRVKTGISSLPGGRSVLGGWLLTVSSSCPYPEDAGVFLNWLSAPENAIPCNVLGGSIPTVSALGSYELRETHPWFSSAFRSLDHALPMLPEGAGISQFEFENSLGRKIHDSIKTGGNNNVK